MHEYCRRSCVRSLMWPPVPYWLGLCQYNVTGCDSSHGLPALSSMWEHVKMSDVSFGTRSRHSLVVDEEFKKPTNQTNKQRRAGCNIHIIILHFIRLIFSSTITPKQITRLFQFITPPACATMKIVLRASHFCCIGRSLRAL